MKKMDVHISNRVENELFRSTIEREDKEIGRPPFMGRRPGD